MRNYFRGYITYGIYGIFGNPPNRSFYYLTETDDPDDVEQGLYRWFHFNEGFDPFAEFVNDLGIQYTEKRYVEMSKLAVMEAWNIFVGNVEISLTQGTASPNEIGKYYVTDSPRATWSNGV